MADVCDLVDDGVNAYAEFSQTIGTNVVSAGEGRVALASVIAQVAIGAGTASAATVQIAGRLTVAAATATVSISDRVTAQNLVSVRATLADFLLPLRTSLVSVAATLGETLRHWIPQSVTARGTGGSAVSQPANVATVVARSATLADAVFQVLAQNSSAAGTGAGSVNQTVRATNLSTAAATASASVSAALSAVALVSVAATGSDARIDALTAENVVTAEGFGSGEMLVAAAGAWTALAETWAMSRWTDLPATSVGVIGGKLFAGGDGLFALDGRDDDGVQFLARIDHGVEELRTPQLKRLSHAYLAAEALGKVTLQVGDHDDGREVLWNYDFERESSLVREPMRTKLGRGHRSRYFRFAVQSRTPFDLAEVLIITDATSRKV